MQVAVPVMLSYALLTNMPRIVLVFVTAAINTLTHQRGKTTVAIGSYCYFLWHDLELAWSLHHPTTPTTYPGGVGVRCFLVNACAWGTKLQFDSQASLCMWHNLCLLCSIDNCCCTVVETRVVMYAGYLLTYALGIYEIPRISICLYKSVVALGLIAWPSVKSIIGYFMYEQ